MKRTYKHENEYFHVKKRTLKGCGLFLSWCIWIFMTGGTMYFISQPEVIELTNRTWLLVLPVSLSFVSGIGIPLLILLYLTAQNARSDEEK